MEKNILMDLHLEPAEFQRMGRKWAGLNREVKERRLKINY